MKHQEVDEMTSQRIRESTRQKLVRLAEIDQRSPVVLLDRLVEAALRDHGVDPKTLEPVAAPTPVAATAAVPDDP